ncbi:flavin-containing monooxygenase [Rhodococcoides yunnanense]|uniref:flavin-containing monooxygenase n=1 Tax=Rhodococcoides yunnanense TaxID=278209 RepID=UPI000A03C06C|nr:NAD(P)/FAD-dependent oxidoreductase [Rhodococcus yunnanensis]
MMERTRTNVDAEVLREHRAGADPAVLLASLVGITGEWSRIDEFEPHFSHEATRGGFVSSLPEADRGRLDQWAQEVLTSLSDYDRDALDLPDEVFARLATVVGGVPVGADSVPFLKEQSGFARFVRTVPRTKAPPTDFTLAIVGAGMAGISLAISAKNAGVDFTVLEKSSGLGGVWSRNQYPGVGVDTPARYYSFSFELNPSWTHRYPDGKQYLDYLDRVAAEYGVLDRFEFGTEVTEAVWSEDSQLWTLTYVQNGERKELRANAVVTAAGYLTNPKLPDVPGVESFTGQWLHSADWNDSVDVTGKRLAIIGTGCTAVQLVDSLVEQADSLTLVQRQPHWIAPPFGVDPLPQAELWFLGTVPTYATWARLNTFALMGDGGYDAVRYDEEWASTHELSISRLNDMALQPSLGHLKASFSDRPDLEAKLTPNYAMMGKRPVRDPGGYYSALKRPTTELVDSGLSEVVPNGIVDGDGVLHEVDIIVYATGFTLEYLGGWNIVGRDGLELADVWRDAPVAYNGCMVPGFPNLFITSGPHSSAAHGGGHNFTVEAVTHYVIESLQALFEQEARVIEVSEQAQKRWDDEVHAALENSIWAREHRASTYYRNERGAVTLPSPFKMLDFWTRLRAPDLDDVIVR